MSSFSIIGKVQLQSKLQRSCQKGIMALLLLKNELILQLTKLALNPGLLSCVPHIPSQTMTWGFQSAQYISTYIISGE